MDKKEICKRIELTNLRPDITKREIHKLLCDAKDYGFGAICINPCWVREAKKLVGTYKLKIVTVVDFPFGCGISRVRQKGALEARLEGADEIDVMISHHFKQGNLKYFIYDLKNIKIIFRGLVKVIIETAFLDKHDIQLISDLVEDSGCDMIKTNTGMYERKERTLLEDIDIIRACTGLPIKAAGGIDNKELLFQLIEKGIERIGMSKGVEVLKEL